ncbi:MAG: hypothetical protein KGK15_10440 [Burkholderiales bacterium]|nr:hypothetical protein [Burkholderiales bacterium]MDE2288660.1 hypothetical protein [Burkholderiales bacterium]MDE2608153.1 hypothetical protein [Burkholderiales bacterium]
MAKGQLRGNKEAKKPKQNKLPGKPISPDALLRTTSTVTVVPDRHKKK